MKFGNTIRTLRKQKGYTLLRLAMDLNINDNYLSEIERGEKIPSIDIAINIINYFGYTFAEFQDITETKEGLSLSTNHIFRKINMIDSKGQLFLYKTLLEFKNYNKVERNV